MKLVMTLVVRNEADIVRANLDYHLANGVDFVIATDHGSSDGTEDVLREYERMGVARVIRDEDHGHHQSRRVTHMARLAHAEHGASWVIHNDADEFWWPQMGSLRDVFAALGDRYGQIVVPRRNFRPLAETLETEMERAVGAGERRGLAEGQPESQRDERDDLLHEQPFHQRLIYREARSTHLSAQPKVAHRAAADVVVAPGNHAISPSLPRAPVCGLIEILHFPMRSYAQFERKVSQTGQGYELVDDRGPGVGDDQLGLLALHRAGRLRAHYDQLALEKDALQEQLRAGTIVVDRRLADFMRRLGERSLAATRPEAPFAGRLLEQMIAAVHDAELAAERLEHSRQALAAADHDARRAREQGGALRAQTHDLQRRVAALDAELADAMAVLEETAQALHLLRTSKLVRHSAWARRLYYRARSR